MQIELSKNATIHTLICALHTDNNHLILFGLRRAQRPDLITKQRLELLMFFKEQVGVDGEFNKDL